MPRPEWMKSLFAATSANLLNRKVSKSRSRHDAAANRAILKRILVEALEQRQLLAADVTALDSFIDEDLSGPNNGQFEISGNPGEVVEFNLTTNGSGSGTFADATAEVGPTVIPIDGSTQTVTLDGSGTALVDVNVIDDPFWDGPAEAVTLTLTGSSGGLGTSLVSSIDIMDDELAPEIDITASDASAVEATLDTAEFQIDVIGDPSDSPINFSLAFSGTAVSGADYSAASSGSVAAGDSSASGPVSPLDDSGIEETEDVGADLSSDTTGVLVGTSFATATIDDDTADTGVISVSSLGDASESPTGTGTTDSAFEISLAGGPSATDTVVSYSVTGSAQPGVDFNFGPIFEVENNNSIVGPQAGTGAQGLGGFVNGVQSVEGTGDGSVDYYAFYTSDGATAPSTFTVTPGGGASYTTSAIRIYDATGTQIGTTSSNPAGLDSEKVVTLPAGPGLYFVGIFGNTTGGGIPDGTYTLDLDVPNTDGYAVLGGGQATLTLPVNVIDDSLVEPTEEVDIELLSKVSGDADITIDTTPAEMDLTDDDAAVIDIDGAVDGVEGTTDGVFWVTISNPVSSTVTVPFTVSGTALNVASGLDTQDHTLMDGDVTIPANSTASVSILVPVVDNPLIEKDETVSITLGTPTAAASPDPTLGVDTDQILIGDDDEGVVNINASIGTGLEAGPVNGEFTISLTEDGVTPAMADSNTVVILNYGGTATAGSDYTAPATTLTIPAFATEFSFAVPVLDDPDVEPNESVVATITGLDFTSTDSNVSVGSSPVDFVTIVSDDVAEVSVEGTLFGTLGADGDEVVGGAPTNGKFVFTQSGGTTLTDTVITYTVGGVADSSDYTPLSGTATILAGTTSTEVIVEVLEDALFEGTETVNITITGVSGGASTVGTSFDSINILDDESGLVSIVASDPTAQEADDDGEFTVTLGGASSGPVLVSYTVAGTATPGSDHGLGTTGTVTFLPNQTSATIPVDVINDAILETGSETVVVTLSGISGAAGYSFGTDTDTVTILRDQQVSVVALTSPGVEGGANAQFLISMDSAADGDVEVTYDILASSTASPSDYTGLSGSATILAGSTAVVVDVTAVDDLVVEGAETIDIELTDVIEVDSNDGDITLSDTATDLLATVSIVDNDAAFVTVSALDDKGTDDPAGSTDAVFLFELSAASSTDTVITYSVGGTATPGDDYDLVPSTVTIPAGDLSTTVLVDVVDDSVIEPDETVTITMTGLDSPTNPNIYLGAIGSTLTPGGAELIYQQGLAVGGVTYAGTLDTYIEGGLSGSNFSGLPEFNVDSGAVSGSEEQQSLLMFSGIFGSGAGQIPMNSVIASADLGLWVVDATDVDPSLYEMIANWPASTITFDNAQFGGNVLGGIQTDDAEAASTSIGDVDAGTAGAMSSSDVTGSVQDWADGTSNYGWVILANSTDEAIFRSSETTVVGTAPMLTVTLDLSATVTICDTDNAVVSVDAASSDGAEGGPDPVFYISQTGTSTTDTVVTYEFTGGSATLGSDYTNPVTGTATILAGNTSVAIDVDVFNDSLLEDTEDVELTITGIVSSDPDVTLSTTPADLVGTVDIDDNDSSDVFVIASSTSGGDKVATEAATDDGLFTFFLTTANTVPTTVNFTVGGTASNGTDYASIPTSVIIPAFATSASVAIDVTNDSTNEPLETVVVSITGTMTPSGPTVGVGSPASDTLDIVDDDALTVSIDATDDTATENSADDGLFTISLNGPSSATTTVVYTVSGTATTGDDFTHIAGTTMASGYTVGTAVFTPGATSTTLNVDALADLLMESPETVVITLSSPTNANGITLGTASDTVTIEDESFKINVEKTDSPASEPGPPAGNNGQFTITMDNPLPTDTVVTYTVAGTATPGSLTPTPSGDYVELPGSATILAGSTQVVIDIDVIDDLLLEADETVEITLTGATDTNGLAMLGTTLDATETIADNDTATISISAANGAEDPTGMSDGLFTIIQSNPGAVATVVDLTLAASSTATSGADFTALPLTVTIPAGQTSATIVVDITDDGVVEATETVTLELDIASGPSGLSEGTDTATVSIVDNDVAEVHLSVPDGTAFEPGNPGIVAVTLRDPGGTPITSDSPTVVTYGITEGADVDSSDYEILGATGLTGVVTIPAGATSATILVNVLDDMLVEDDETVAITLSTAPFTIAAPGPGVVTILDNDSAEVSIDGTTDGSENNGGSVTDGVFTVSLDKLSDVDTVVSYTVTGSATPGPGNDFTALSGSVTILANTPSATIVVPVLEDAIAEVDETVIVTLDSITSGHGPANIFGGSIVTISATDDADSVSIDDDDAPEFTIADSSMDEDGNIVFVVSLDKEIDIPVSVDVTYTDGTATGGGVDYDSATDSVTFPANTTGTMTVVVAVNDDDIVEDDEEFTASLSITSALGGRVVNTGPDATGTILDDDDTSFVISDVSVVEGSTVAVGPGGAYTVMTFSVSANDMISSATTLNISFADVTATGSDFTAEWGTVALPTEVTGDYDNAPQTLTYPANSTAPMTFTVLVKPDFVLEGDAPTMATPFGVETFEVTVTPVGTSLTGDSATGTIEDDDAAEISSAATIMVASEPDTDGLFTLTMSQTSQTATTVTYSLGGTADIGVDYVDPVTYEVTIPAGATQTTIDITVIDNPILEDDETVVLSLVSVSSGDANITLATPSGPAADTITILDDDSATVSVVATTQASEPGTDGVFTFELTEMSDTNTVINYSVATGAGQATPDVDYTALTGTVTIPANSLTTTLDVSVIDDALDEPSEDVTVTLTGFQTPTNADITIDGSADEAIVTIADDDGPISVTIEFCGDGNEEGESDGCFFIVLRDGAGNPVAAPSGGVQVGFTTPSGTASQGVGNDYNVPGTAFIPGGASSTTVSVDVEDDLIAEGDETVILGIDTIISSGSYTTPPPGTTGTFVVDPSTASITILDNDVVAPQVASTIIEDGDVQRSMVRKLKVTFDAPVAWMPDAFTVEQRDDVGGPGGILGTIEVGTGLIVTDVTPATPGAPTEIELTFDESVSGNALIVAGSDSLVDGNFQVVIDNTKVMGVGSTGPSSTSLLDGDADGTGGDDYTFGDAIADDFFRLFGNVDGDIDTDALDFSQFIAAFGGTYNDLFDDDGDGDVDALDFSEFIANFGASRDLGGF